MANALPTTPVLYENLPGRSSETNSHGTVSKLVSIAKTLAPHGAGRWFTAVVDGLDLFTASPTDDGTEIEFLHGDPDCVGYRVVPYSGYAVWAEWQGDELFVTLCTTEEAAQDTVDAIYTQGWDGLLEVTK